METRADDRMPPGPDPIPGLGAIPRLLQYGRDPIGTATRLFARYGPLASIVRAPINIMTPNGRAVFVGTGADLNREVLTQHDRYRMYALPGNYYPDDEVLARAANQRGLARFTRPSVERLRPVRRLLTGLFHVNGDEHRRHRRLLMPAFHKTRIDAYRDDMVTITERVLSTYREGETRDVLADMTELTLRVATKTLFGEEAGDRGLQLARDMQVWLETMFSPAMLLGYDVRPLPLSRWLDLSARIERDTAEIVREKRKRLAGGDVGRDMLSMLIAARDEDGSALDEDDLVGHAGVIFAAGHETSTNALAWTLMLLSQHPEIAANLHEELAVLGGDAPTVEQLGKLTYLDAVVKESLRILPPVPLHPRVVGEDHELAGRFLPKHSELFLSIFHLHHDPALFPNPRGFTPDRWSKIKPSTFEYNPFSAGPRMCIGAAFAMMEIKIALAVILQRFRLELPRGARVDRRVMITMAPKHGLKMTVRRADKGWKHAPMGVRGNIRQLVELPA